MKKLVAIMLIVAMGMFAASADAKTISINFSLGGAHDLAPGDIAGVSAVQAANWNNVSAHAVGMALVDENGAATGVTLDTAGWGFFGNNASTGGFSGNPAMMNSGIKAIGGNWADWDPAQALLRGLAAEMPDGYDVYLYVGDDDWGHAYSNTANGYESNTAADFDTGNKLPNPWPTGNETETLAFTAAANGTVFSGTFTPGGNYVLFSGKSADLAVYSVWGTQFGPPPFTSAQFNGMQIVGVEEQNGVVPEPAGLGLVGLALLAVRKRRS